MRSFIDLVETAQSMPHLVSFDELYHVGDMKAELKGMGSYEGSGLSVSLHPEEWQHIARLTGTTWTLTKHPNRFLDYHAMTEADHASMVRWGVEHGWIEERTVYGFAYYDDEADAEYTQTFATREEAEREAEEYDAEVEESPGHMVGTAKLKQRCRQRGIDLQPQQLLVTIWADDVLHLDGVWWEDDLNVHQYSAPRGVIFTSRLGEWTVEPNA